MNVNYSYIDMFNYIMTQHRNIQCFQRSQMNKGSQLISIFCHLASRAVKLVSTCFEYEAKDEEANIKSNHRYMKPNRWIIVIIVVVAG